MQDNHIRVFDATASNTVERYDIEHLTRYDYPQPVTLDQMVIRMQPRTSPAQRLIQFTIDVDPKPSKHTHGIDLHGNIRHWFWFEQSHDHLQITTHSTIDCRLDNPFDFIIVEPGLAQVPATYGEPIHSASAHYRQRADLDPSIDQLANEIRDACDGSTLNFLWVLVTRLYEQLQHIVRPEGSAWSPHRTLREGKGACRDEALLFAEVCRAMGLAARFVSGYAWDAVEEDGREMHAWAEVYIPGAGWRGYDTTIGEAVSNRHIAVAASPTAAYAAPLEGTFTAPPLQSKLQYEIKMDRQTFTQPQATEVTYRWA